MVKSVITWDLGGTKCAAGIVSIAGDNFSCDRECIVELGTVDSLDNLVRTIEDQLHIKHSDVDAVCIGAAGVFDGSILKLQKGYPFAMNIATVALAQKWPSYAVVHDYIPIVCASFFGSLKTIELRKGIHDEGGRRVAFGIGTGLGLKDGIKLPDGNFWLGMNEIGHIGICNTRLVPAHLQGVHQELCQAGFCFEDVLSGPGMIRLHSLMSCEVPCSPVELGKLIHAGKANLTLGAFAFYVGLFSATVELTFMPSGGLFIAGGVVLKHHELFLLDEFAQGLRAAPAYANERARFPMHIITDEHAAMLGAAYFASKRLLS